MMIVTIDLLLDILHENGTRVFRDDSFFDSFRQIVALTKDYLTDCRTGKLRDQRTERDLGGAWIAAAGVAVDDLIFAQACRAAGLRLCRAPSAQQYTALESELFQEIKSAIFPNQRSGRRVVGSGSI